MDILGNIFATVIGAVCCRFVIDLMALIIGQIFLFSLAYAVWRKIRTDMLVTDLAVYLFLYTFFASALVLILGLMHALSPIWILVTSLIGGMFLWSGHIARGWLDIREAQKVWRALAVRHRLPVGIFLLLLAPAIFRSLFHSWFLPPYVYDVLTYHLPKVADWVRHQHLVMVPTNIHRAFWPSNFELFQTWFVVFFHHDALVEWAGLPFYFAGILAVTSMARALGCSRWSSLVAGVLYAYTPAVLQNAVCAKNDIAVAAIYLLAVALMLDDRVSFSGTGRRLLVLVLALVYAVGTKPYIVFIAPGLIVVGLGCLLTRRNRPDSTPEKSMSVPISLCAGLLVVSLGVAMYWYVRNYILFSNPFYPADFELFGRLIFGTGNGGAQQGSFSFYSLLENTRALFSKKIWDRNILGPELCQLAGWGWVVMAAGLPCAGWALVFQRSFRYLLGGFSLSLLVLFGWVTPDPWNMRFALWMPAVFCVAISTTFAHLRSDLIRRALILLVAICIFLNVLASIGNGYLTAREWVGQISTSLRDRSTASMVGGKYAYALQQLSPGDILAYDTHPDDWLYPFYGADFSRGVRFVPADDKVVKRMDELGLRYFYIMMPLEKLERERGIALSGLLPIKYGLYVRELK